MQSELKHKHVAPTVSLVLKDTFILTNCHDSCNKFRMKYSFSSSSSSSSNSMKKIRMSYCIIVTIGCLLLAFMWHINLQAHKIIRDNDDPRISESHHSDSYRRQRQVSFKLNNSTVTIGYSHDRVNNHDRPNNPQKLPNPTYQKSPSSPYAYAWVVGGIHEDRPSYKGFIWTILVSAKLLRQTGSTADFWAYFRLSPDSKMNHLETTDMQALKALGVNTVLLERPLKESFAQLVYDKFLTINMTQYKRVMFLDADILPLTNLDYYFHLSDPDFQQVPTLLQPNFIVASRHEPCNTGMFMVEPSSSSFETFKNVVRTQHLRSQSLPYPHFDFREGWGHNFEEQGDYWEGIHQRGTKWKFHAGHSDQGLMYYFSKYVIMNVSIAIGDKIQNWREGEGGTHVNDGNVNTSISVQASTRPILVSEERGILAPYQGKLLRYQFECDTMDNNNDNESSLQQQQQQQQQQENNTNTPIHPITSSKQEDVRWRCVPPYSSVAHFMGIRKPWRRRFDFKIATDSSKGQSGARYLWFQELQNISDELGMGLDLREWNDKYLDDMKDELLGQFAQYHDILNATRTLGI